MQRRIYLDLDGVLADFDAAYEARFGVHPSAHDDDVLWPNINGCDRYFADLPPCPGAIDFFMQVAPFEPTILTACPKSNYQAVARQKREWVRRHLGWGVPVLPVMGGANKVLFMHAPGDILIDDFEKNLAPWRAEGGVAILHTGDWAWTKHALLEALCTRPVGAPA